MTDQKQAPIQQNKIIFLLAAVATFSGLLIVFVFQFTAPIIEKNKQELIKQALSKVIPKSTIHKEFKLLDNQLVPAKKAQNGISIYAGYNQFGELLGIAAETQAAGYQDIIKILYGYSPKCECITGIKILKTSETPGLGDKIYKDQEFVKNFDALDARLDKTTGEIANPIITVKHGNKTKAWQIDSISGATVSSRAIGVMLKNSTVSLLPTLKPLLATITQIEVDDVR